MHVYVTTQFATQLASKLVDLPRSWLSGFTEGYDMAEILYTLLSNHDEIMKSHKNQKQNC